MSKQNYEKSAVVSAASVERLPFGRLLAFTMASFLAIVTETMPAGLLPQIGQGLNISEALAGQLITLYALGSILAAIPVIAPTCSWNRRPLFFLAIGVPLGTWLGALYDWRGVFWTMSILSLLLCVWVSWRCWLCWGYPCSGRPEHMAFDPATGPPWFDREHHVTGAKGTLSPS